MTNLRARLGKSVLIAASLMAAASGLQARTLDAVKSGGALRVTVYNDYKPWSWKEDGVAKGIDVDLAAALRLTPVVEGALREMRAQPKSGLFGR